jgi:nicotinamide phosphoribosyltransferase
MLMTDFYKVDHHRQYPANTQEVYSNLTARSNVHAIRDFPDFADKVVVFGIQAFILEILVTHFHENFFSLKREAVRYYYQRRMDTSLGKGAVDIENILSLHKLGFLPIKIKALPEGSLCPMKVPFLTIRNTNKDFGWLTNSLETMISDHIWKPMTSATTAYRFRRNFERFAEITGADKAFIDWQGHDFSFRGMNGFWDAASSGGGHLLSFLGTDTIPAIDWLEQFYMADSEEEMVGGSVFATEHAVMCLGLEEGEEDTFDRLLFKTYPSAVVSIVSDTWDYWSVLNTYCRSRADAIKARGGKFVVRPDSGDPLLIICGDPSSDDERAKVGTLELLWSIFGGTFNEKGYRKLHPSVGLIYGDSITLARQQAILGCMEEMGFASDNVVFGLGSFTYQYVTRDTYGFAIKATSGVVNGVRHALQKTPATDVGSKKSARGLLRVEADAAHGFILHEDQTPEQEETGALETVYLDGKLVRVRTLAEIRSRLRLTA